MASYETSDKLRNQNWIQTENQLNTLDREIIYKYNRMRKTVELHWP